MSEPLEFRIDEDDEQPGQQHEPDERQLTQRELVRASLLRCPPPQVAESPRR